ncbi:uncharacterized protein MONOS_6970 [Monocercomonoides exilis]|uniref:uncharacterized protein n=1 Tax=Monocercomonoides exilis TaxID=2049356 RepID=UPI00355A33C3|nr:hypothetical protein MONOS_6970 [Monocercomonoides exilis]|eukprot:MONOS_6970.1-p1 / transcript=MONOS_6970.1 / gene=MONOS_6970 / organism=Monocercomonoides_exilis_PA203 / gene_product=unspecified product / transcript_product=unspecified product / location=Mono_scaffold00229:43511-45872(+) / protein_length=468 / sequence_SO=supercontig / SO=protein_coding / is_pseudo=false
MFVVAEFPTFSNDQSATEPTRLNFRFKSVELFEKQQQVVLNQESQPVKYRMSTLQLRELFASKEFVSELWHIDSEESEGAPCLIAVSPFRLISLLDSAPIRFDIVTRCLETTCKLCAYNEEKTKFQPVCTITVLFTLEDRGPTDPSATSPDMAFFPSPYSIPPQSANETSDSSSVFSSPFDNANQGSASQSSSSSSQISPSPQLDEKETLRLWEELEVFRRTEENTFIMKKRKQATEFLEEFTKSAQKKIEKERELLDQKIEAKKSQKVELTQTIEADQNKIAELKERVSRAELLLEAAQTERKQQETLFTKKEKQINDDLDEELRSLEHQRKILSDQFEMNKKRLASEMERIPDIHQLEGEVLMEKQKIVRMEKEYQSVQEDIKRIHEEIAQASRTLEMKQLQSATDLAVKIRSLQLKENEMKDSFQQPSVNSSDNAKKLKEEIAQFASQLDDFLEDDEDDKGNPK